ncbi:hypothetical protein [Deinococcus sp. S9]|uniref:hypothetical protein n=1 Tax=Deinococcus sp. S9 TaxID=2545754 RepID=UPI00105605D8|nr:hypothetical protein [Deinococcus sp. S9]TDE85583.1 hypothetical protein E0686_11265 [Deinococcus sp. S9]
MLQAAKTVNVYIDFPDLVQVAAEDPQGRLAVRTPTGIVSFFPVGEALEARVTQAQADYLARIEGIQVEGREPKPAARPQVDDWIREGERLAKARQQTGAQTPQQDPLAALVALLGGAENVKSILAAAIAQQAGQVAQTAQAQLDAQQEELARKQAEREAAQGWTFFKLQGKLSSEQAVELLSEFDPAYNVDGKHGNALLSQVARVANDNHVLSDRLAELI